jgi:glycosyltransferase involved in cell wall biosynthesis
MDTKFTVFTPTYNRAGTLYRVYNSLLNQSYKNFVWLIIDDGSTDNTRDIVQGWLDESKLKIDYHYKKNGGKHTAMRMAYDLAATKYFLAIDSDDELTPDALEVFNEEWVNLEQNPFGDQFAEVSALTHFNDGKLFGNYIFPATNKYIDSNWHEMVLKNRNNNEHIVCWNLDKLKECVKIPDKFWLSDKVSFFNEATLWARIGKKYKTRYLNKGLRLYYFDGGDSLLRITDKVKGHYNNLAGQKYFLDENLEYFLWNPRFFFNLILKFIISGIAVKNTPLTILREIGTVRFKLVYSLCLPLGFAAYLYFRFIKKKYWF